MLVKVKVPILAESISEATLASWNKKPGDVVQENENLVDMETDKVMLEIVAPKKGVLKEIRKSEGEAVSSDEVIAVIDTSADSAIGVNSKAANEEPSARPTASAAKNDTLTPGPAARKLLAEHQLSADDIRGTGAKGRVTKADVLSHIENQELIKDDSLGSADSKLPVQTQLTTPVPTPATPVQKADAIPQTSIGGFVNNIDRPEKRVPMTRLRAKVAQRLKEAQNTAAILTTFNEVNMQPVMELRNRYKDKFYDRHGVKLGFMSFFTKAVVESLKQFPIINSSVDDNDIIYHGFYDIGIAVGSPRGLVVPILRNVDTMSFADIEKSIQTYGQKARDGKLSIEDLTGGTFSISNGGVYGSMMSTPILNPPQSAILGMHNIVERPMAENGQVVIRPMMYLALSYDHRIIDGHDAVLFLVSIKQAIEDPARLLLEL